MLAAARGARRQRLYTGASCSDLLWFSHRVRGHNAIGTFSGNMHFWVADAGAGTGIPAVATAVFTPLRQFCA